MQMKKLRRFNVLLSIIAAAFLSSCCTKHCILPSAQVFDTLPKNRELQVHISKGLDSGSLSDKDFQGICSAVSRTPNIDYEIRAISTFPDQHRPMAACVRTKRHLVFLFQSNADEWHVFRIADYYY
jgi:hypothetical protein